MAQRGLILDISFAGYVAVVDETDKPLAHRWRVPGARYDDVAQWIEECLSDADAGFSDLAWITVNVGPGSFTGIRIAMAFAQGLAMPRNIPLHGFTSFAPMLLSREPERGERLVVAIPANSGRFYVSTGLEDAGKLMESSEFIDLGHSQNGKTTLILPARIPSIENAISNFGSVVALEDRWNVSRLMEYVRYSGLDANRPYYLQLSAAEEKAAG